MNEKEKQQIEEFFKKMNSHLKEYWREDEKEQDLYKLIEKDLRQSFFND